MKRKRWNSKTKTKILLEDLLAEAASNSPWDLANKTIYDLCRKHPKHKDDKEIIAKVWIIGRTYAAAIERSKSRGKFKGNDFYVDCVAKCIRKSHIDEWFSSLKDIRSLDHDTLKPILKVHCKVTNLFEDISEQEKRSLASKYLHFHFPKLFFLYDSRTKNAIKKLSNIIGRAGRFDGCADNEYRKFCEKCLKLRDHIKEQFGKTLKPRELDKLLLDLSRSKS